MEFPRVVDGGADRRIWVESGSVERGVRERTTGPAHFNFKSVFAWNVFLYSGMTGIVAVYLWTMFERRFNRFSKPAGLAALVWRFVLTTGTGSIFAFLVARQAYQSALLARGRMCQIP